MLEEPDISLSIVNSKACFHLYLYIMHVLLAQSMVACEIHVAMILYIVYWMLELYIDYTGWPV